MDTRQLPRWNDKLTAVVDTIRTSDGDAPEGALHAAEALSSSTPGTRKTYIYIGTLADLQAKGAGIEGWVSETSAPTGQEAWRAALENQVLSSEYCARNDTPLLPSHVSSRASRHRGAEQWLRMIDGPAVQQCWGL